MTAISTTHQYHRHTDHQQNRCWIHDRAADEYRLYRELWCTNGHREPIKTRAEPSKQNQCAGQLANPKAPTSPELLARVHASATGVCAQGSAAMPACQRNKRIHAPRDLKEAAMVHPKQGHQATLTSTNSSHTQHDHPPALRGL